MEAEKVYSQWREAEAQQEKFETEFYANFLTKYPHIKIIRIHDSWLFESPEHYQLFLDEFKKWKQKS